MLLLSELTGRNFNALGPAGACDIRCRRQTVYRVWVVRLSPPALPYLSPPPDFSSSEVRCSSNTICVLTMFGFFATTNKGQYGFTPLFGLSVLYLHSFFVRPLRLAALTGKLVGYYLARRLFMAPV